MEEGQQAYEQVMSLEVSALLEEDQTDVELQEKISPLMAEKMRKDKAVMSPNRGLMIHLKP